MNTRTKQTGKDSYARAAAYAARWLAHNRLWRTKSSALMADEMRAAWLAGYRSTINEKRNRP